MCNRILFDSNLVRSLGCEHTHHRNLHFPSSERFFETRMHEVTSEGLGGRSLEHICVQRKSARNKSGSQPGSRRFGVVCGSNVAAI
jgi:hypothetical protein